MRAFLIVTAVWLALAGRLGADESDHQVGKLPEQEAAAVELATRLIKVTFRSEFARQGKSRLRDLAVKLFQLALETHDDDAARFALYSHSISRAARAGELGAALFALDQLSYEFSVARAERMLQIMSMWC